MQEIKKYTSLFAVLLLAIGAFRMDQLSTRSGFPLFNFLNFSNLLVYTFDIIHGLLYYAAPIVIYLILKKGLSHLWVVTWVRRFMSRCTCNWRVKKIFKITVLQWIWIIQIIVIVPLLCLILFRYYYQPDDLPFCRNMVVKYFAEIFIIYEGYLLTRFKSVDSVLVKYSSIIFFLFCYMKINAKYESFATNSNNNKGMVIVKLKGDKPESVKSQILLTNTSEFLFLKQPDTSIVIPMAEVRTILFVHK